MGGEGAIKAKNPSCCHPCWLRHRWLAQNLLQSAVAQSVWKGMAAVVDLRAQTSEEREKKWEEGEVSGTVVDLRAQTSEEREKKWEEGEVSGSGSGDASGERGRGSYAPLIRGGYHVYAHWSH